MATDSQNSLMRRLLRTGRRALQGVGFDHFTPHLGVLRQYAPRPMRVPPAYAAEKPPSDPPRIAIVTPSLNNGEFIQATIASVLGQGYANLVYHVQDGGSTDGTQDILRGYKGALSWRSERDSGQANAINRGFASLDGDVMAYLNSDDILLPGTLNYVARYFAEHPDIDVVYGHRICIDTDGQEIGRWLLPAHDNEVMTYVDFVPQETMFWRRRVWSAVGPLAESLNFALDWDFILRAQAKGFQFRRLPRFLGCFRIHDRQKTGAMHSIGQEECDTLRQRTFGRVPSPVEVTERVRAYVWRHVFIQFLFRLGWYQP